MRVDRVYEIVVQQPAKAEISEGEAHEHRLADPRFVHVGKDLLYTRHARPRISVEGTKARVFGKKSLAVPSHLRGENVNVGVHKPKPLGAAWVRLGLGVRSQRSARP